MIRKIGLLVGNKPVGVARTWAYPNGDSRVHFRIPLYHLTVSGLLDNGTPDQRVFDVLRFGVTKEASKTQPHVVGLAELQTHTIQSWQPTYKVHSAATAEIGAWQVYANFLIHDGPDEPTLLPVYATIGCIEICGMGRNSKGMPQGGFDNFNDYAISLSGSVAATRDAKLAEIGQSGMMTITYLKASRPPLVPW